MSDPALTKARVDELVARWEELLKEGQFVPADELCADCPELIDAVQDRIDELDNYVAEETAAGDVGVMVTVFEDNASREDGGPGALVLHQHFRKLRFHAKGGLGEIYIADDQDLQRDVVIKFIRPKHRDRRDCREQFRTEAEVTARLDHPGVVPVYGFGHTPDGRMCYAMRFIQGESLEQRIVKLHSAGSGDATQRRSSASLFSPSRAVEFRSLLNRFATVCRTIAYAHNRGILHRDIKPENVMLGKYGDTLVVDWGLAMAIDRDDSARASGEETLMPTSGSGTSSSGMSGGPVGTPAYMSPEQANGAPNIGPASDIFSLGATLYKLLSGHAPYFGESARDSINRAKYASYPPPSSSNPDIPAPLEAVCLKAMSLNPGDRYITAAELADDLDRWLADEPVLARQETRLEKTIRWFRNNRGWTVALLSVLVVVFLGFAATAVVQGRAADREREAADRERTARDSEYAAHIDSLQLSARFIARTVGHDLQLRWLILQRAARDPELVAAIRRIEAAGESFTNQGDTPLQAWLLEHMQTLSSEGEPAESKSWVVVLRDGSIAGRAPWSDKIGDFYGYRDYFHGMGRDIEESAAREKLPPPIERPHRSIAFLSTSTNSWTVSLTVPVRAETTDENGNVRSEVIGVLGMSQQLDNIAVLKAPLNGDRVVLLVDSGENENGDRGTILHDSRHGTDQRVVQKAGRATVSDRFLFDLIALRDLHRRTYERSAGSLPPDSELALRKDYDDYLDSDRKWVAACEPVMFRRARDYRGGQSSQDIMEDTGWIVIVQEPARSDAAPTESDAPENAGK